MKDRVLFLTLRTFSLTGGIEKVCRTLARVLSDLCSEPEVRMYSMYDHMEDLDKRYIKPENFRGFATNKGTFLWASFFRGVRSDKVILSHINLLIFGWLVKKVSPSTEIILLAHGIEVWRELRSWKKHFLRKDCRIWAVSSYTAGVLKERHDIPPERIQVLNNGLDPFFSVPEIKERPDQLVYKHGILKSDPILFTLTRIASTEGYKGYDLVLEVLPEIIRVHPTLLYFIAGQADPEEQLRLEVMIEALNLENNVVLLGYIPEDKVSKYYQLSDVFIMPSRKEGFGLVFIEAAACGTRVIAGNQDGSSDALLQGRLGTLINPQDKTGIRNAIIKSLSDSDTDGSRLIQRTCLKHFSYQAYRERVRKLITHRYGPPVRDVEGPQKYQIITAP